MFRREIAPTKPFVKSRPEVHRLKAKSEPFYNRLETRSQPVTSIPTAPLLPQPILLLLIGMTASEYLHHLECTPQLSPPPELKRLAIPILYCLTAPPELKLLPAYTSTPCPEQLNPIILAERATFESEAVAQSAFEQFLVQAKVYDKARTRGWSRSALLEADDIAQMVVIRLWERWWQGREPIRQRDLISTIREICRSNKWTWRVRESKTPELGAIESAMAFSSLVEDLDQPSAPDPLDVLVYQAARGENIRGTEGVDCRLDVQAAIETVILYMMLLESWKPPRQRTQPHLIPDYLTTLFQGYLYYRNGGAQGHIGGRHNSYLLGYWQQQGLHKAAGLRWRDRTFPLMASLLGEYAPRGEASNL